MYYRILLRSSFAVLAALALFASDAMAQPGQQDEKPENLQVLPDDMAMQDVRRVMGSFTRALGVRCIHCHEGEEGQPLSTYDFASDEVEAKETTRVMMRMVQHINGEFISEAAGDGEALNVTCQTCHRGVARPMLLEDLLADVAMSEGIDAAIAEYHRLRDEYYGAFAYNFQEPTLIALSQQLLDGDMPDDALRFLDLNAELFPNSSQTYAAMGQAHLAKDDTAAALRSVEKAVELNPNNRRLQEWLEDLRNQ